MKGEAEESKLNGLLGRRAVLQSISSLAIAPRISDLTRASEVSGALAVGKTRRMHIDQRYVLFPINNKSSSRRVRLSANGAVLRSFTGSLGLPADWWAHLDVRGWMDRVLTLSIEPGGSPPAIAGGEVLGRGESETSDDELVRAVRTSPEIWSPETVYREPLRPAFHFSCRRGWINDPNGLVYHEGKYHLFFQHNPYGLRSENKHWGHAVSTDLVHWKELPIALYPRGENDFPYSGSGIADRSNTSGWGKKGGRPMVIAFTSTGRGECVAWSNDEGAEWHEFEGNPIVRHQGRDPKIFWHDDTKRWVMAVYDERPSSDGASINRQGIAFHTSPDLKSWQERSWIEGYFECPDLFALPVDGDPGKTKWVLTCGSGDYSIGQFDGVQFTPETARLPGPAGGVGDPGTIWAELSSLFYAGQTFANHPTNDRVQIGWGRVEAAGEPFTQICSFPAKLSLRTTRDGIRLCREPIDAIRSLRIRSYEIPASPMTASPLLANLEGDAWDVETIIRVGTVAPVHLTIGDDEYVYHPQSQMMSGPHGSMAIPLEDGRLHLRILVDRTVVEIFGARGQAFGMYLRDKPGRQARLSLRTWNILQDGMQLERLTAHALRSAWMV